MLAPQLPLTNRPVNRRTSSHTCTRSTCRDTEVYTHFQAAPQIAPRTQTYAYTKGVNVGLGTVETLSAWFGAGAAICRLGRNFLDQPKHLPQHVIPAKTQSVFGLRSFWGQLSHYRVHRNEQAHPSVLSTSRKFEFQHHTLKKKIISHSRHIV